VGECYYYTPSLKKQYVFERNEFTLPISFKYEVLVHQIDELERIIADTKSIDFSTDNL
jgi:hypothetical protein